ncbi:MAG: hypothetical protein JJE52_14920 [Acidimicrobiia bacterium]|nr:hypothetical protein [Acidimicrobiia bacterium]
MTNTNLAKWAHRLVGDPWRSVLTAAVPLAAAWLAAVAVVPLEMGSAYMALAIAVVPVVAVGFSVTEGYAGRWARDRGARFAPHAVGPVHRYLLRTRLSRTAGVTGTIAANIMLTAHYNADPDAFGWFVEVWQPLQGWWLIALGYVLGSAWAEATKPRDRDAALPGAAVLMPRRVADYLDPGLARVLRWFAGLSAVAVVLWVVTPGGTSTDPASNAGPARLDDAWAAVLCLGVAGLSLGCAAWVCRRRQHAHDDSALVDEELTRTATANALTGAVVAMLGGFAGGVVQEIWQNGRISGWLVVPFWVAGLLSLGVWMGSGTSFVFRTKRIDAMRARA